MGLTSILNSSRKLPTQYQKFRDYMKEIVPKRAEVRTVSGVPAFSYRYILKAPYDYNLSKYNLAAPLGHAFDYLARLMMARRLDDRNHSKNEVTANLMAGYAFYTIPESMKLTKGYSKLVSEYDSIYNKMQDYVHGDLEVDALYSSMYMLALMEGIVRKSNFSREDDKLALLEDRWQLPYELDGLFISQLDMLCDTFNEFLDTSGFVKHGSNVIFNPMMGTEMPRKLGGADADIFIDGCLIDFKTTKNYGYDWKEFAQVFGYAILASISRELDKKNGGYSDLAYSQIDRIAIYKARYGELEYVNVSMNEIQHHADYIINLFF